MLAASICHEIYYTVLPSTIMSSRVPRCLFGRPNSRETMEMLQEALDAERSKFARRWGVDPCSEDKENNYQRRNNERSDRSPGKKRSNPYSRQTSIHGEQHFSREISTRELYRLASWQFGRVNAPHAYARGICMREHESRAFDKFPWTNNERKFRGMHVPRAKVGRPTNGFHLLRFNARDSKNISYA